MYAYETNNLADMGVESPGAGAETVDWTDGQLAQVTRLRLVTDPGFPFWDVSYCWGKLADGTAVRVRLPFFQLPKGAWKSGLIDAAKRDGVYAKRLGIFDAVSMIW